MLVKYHWIPKLGVRNLTQAEAEQIQGKNFNHATQDLYEAIERGEFPEWEFCVQIMSDDEHSELDFDPLDDTKIWPEAQFPLKPIGRMVLDRNPVNYFAEVEQAAFGTGVLVDGLDFRTTRCCKAARCPIPIHNAIELARITCSFQLTARKFMWRPISGTVK